MSLKSAFGSTALSEQSFRSVSSVKICEKVGSIFGMKGSIGTGTSTESGKRRGIQTHGFKESDFHDSNSILPPMDCFSQKSSDVDRLVRHSRGARSVLVLCTC